MPTHNEEIQAELERLRAENEALKQAKRGSMSMKVSEKGAVSVYDLRPFPGHAVPGTVVEAARDGG